MLRTIIGIALDCPDPNVLANFYAGISGWKKEITGDEWAGIRTPEGILLVFQRVEAYEPPIWPWEKGKQQQMIHLDFLVDDLKKAEALAIKNGAKRAEIQYFDTSTVLFDPAGHPFCLSTVAQ